MAYSTNTTTYRYHIRRIRRGRAPPNPDSNLYTSRYPSSNQERRPRSGTSYYRTGAREEARGYDTYFETEDLESEEDQDHGQSKEGEAFCSAYPVLFDDYVTENTMSVIGCHTEGEPCDVVVGGIPDPKGETMRYKQLEFMRQHEWRRDLLLNEPRGHCGQNAVFMVPASSSRAVRGLIFAKNEEYVQISISSLIAAAQVTVNGPGAGAEIKKLRLPTTKLTFDTPAGLIDVDVRLKPRRSAGAVPKCESVTVHGVPSFVLELDFELDLYGIGVFSVDISYGGVLCAFVDAASVGVSIDGGNGQKMVEIGERIKNALNESYEGGHPLESHVNTISAVIFTEPVTCKNVDRRKDTIMAAIISPGRLDRSPSGTAVCARLAILHARGEIHKESLTCQSIIGTKFHGRIRGTTKVDRYPAILPSVMGRAWIHSLKQVGLNPEDPFPEGFRNADQWGPDEQKKKRTNTYKLRDLELPVDW